MNKLTDKLATKIGELEIQNSALETQIEDLTDKNNKLQAKLDAQNKPSGPTDGPSAEPQEQKE